MKTNLTKNIELRALKEFAKMGNFICNEVGINIKRFGFNKRVFKGCKLSEQDLIDKWYVPDWYTSTEIVDVLVWESNKNIWKCFEIKISVNDFKSSAALTFIGNYNYYIIPDYLISKVEYMIPDHIGIYKYDTSKFKYDWQPRLSCYKRAKKQELKCTYNEINYGMIKSLYRELRKYKKDL